MLSQGTNRFPETSSNFVSLANMHLRTKLSNSHQEILSKCERQQDGPGQYWMHGLTSSPRNGQHITIWISTVDHNTLERPHLGPQWIAPGSTDPNSGWGPHKVFMNTQKFLLLNLTELWTNEEPAEGSQLLKSKCSVLSNTNYPFAGRYMGVSPKPHHISPKGP